MSRKPGVIVRLFNAIVTLMLIIIGLILWLAVSAKSAQATVIPPLAGIVHCSEAYFQGLQQGNEYQYFHYPNGEDIEGTSFIAYTDTTGRLKMHATWYPDIMSLRRNPTHQVLVTIQDSLGASVDQWVARNPSFLLQPGIKFDWYMTTAIDTIYGGTLERDGMCLQIVHDSAYQLPEERNAVPCDDSQWQVPRTRNGSLACGPVLLFDQISFGASGTVVVGNTDCLDNATQIQPLSASLWQDDKVWICVSEIPDWPVRWLFFQDPDDNVFARVFIE